MAKPKTTSRQQAQDSKMRKLLYGPPVKLKQPIDFRAERSHTDSVTTTTATATITSAYAQTHIASRNWVQFGQISNQENMPNFFRINNKRIQDNKYFIKASKIASFLLVLSTILLAASSITGGKCDTTDNGGKMTATAPGLQRQEWSKAGSIGDSHRTKLEARHDTGGSASNREKILSSLAETVAQQHLKATSHSGSAKWSASSSKTEDPYMKLYEAHEKHMPSIKMTPPILTTSLTSNKSPASLTSTNHNNNKAAQDMHQILMMHELQQFAAVSPKRDAKSPPSTQVDAGPARKPIANKLRLVTNGLHKNLASSSGQSSKALASVLSFVSPLATSNGNTKAIPIGSVLHSFSDNVSRALAGPKKSAPLPAQGSSGSTKSKATRQHNPNVNLFSPRANGLAMAVQQQLMGQLLGLGQLMFAPSDNENTNKYNNLIDTTSTAKLQGPANSARLQQQDNKPDPLGALARGLKLATGARSPLFPGSKKSSVATKSSSNDLEPAESGLNQDIAADSKSPQSQQIATSSTTTSTWLRNGANLFAQSYLQDSLRDFLTLSQLPILSNGGPVSTAPSDLEPGGKKWLAQRAAAQQDKGNRTQTLDDILRYAYIFGLGGVRRKRDPLKALNSKPTSAFLPLSPSSQTNRRPARAFFTQPKGSESFGGQKLAAGNQALAALSNLGSMLTKNRNAKPRGVMWEMATDPTLAVTVLHLMERASVALPLGFLLMPFVKMVRTNPLHHIPIDLARILPARATHRSVDYEELAKRLDMMDKILSRALRQTHREATFMG